MRLSEEQQQEWNREQERVREQAVLQDDVDWSLNPHDATRPPLSRVGGVDVSFCADGEGGERAFGCLAVLAFPSLALLREDHEERPAPAPYAPGYLAAREGPLYEALLRRAAASEHAPQVVLVDGCGALHPRRAGAACELGVRAALPTVGVAKTLLSVDGLTRKHVAERLCAARAAGGAGDSAAARADLGLSADDLGGCIALPLHGGSGEGAAAAEGAGEGPVLGAALCTPRSCRPMYVSAGHRLSLATALRLVRRCCVHRVPEPLRQADLRSRARARAWDAARRGP